MTRVAVRERIVPWAVIASVIAVIGVLVTVFRPLAPPLPDLETELLRFDAAVLEAVEAYRTPRRISGLVRVAITVAIPVLVVWTRAGRRLVARLAGREAHAPLRGGLVAAAVAALVDLVTFPLSLWTGYLHETRWLFRTSPFDVWLRDWFVARVPGWLIAAAGAAALLWAMHRWPRSWHWRSVVAGTAVAAVLVLARPIVFEPLFLRTEPLEDGPVREHIEAILLRAGFHDSPIVVGDASRRTRKVNAYVTGLGPSRRVVLYDNLLALHPDEIGAVVGHEVAHHLHRDIERGVLLGAAGLLLGLAVMRTAVRSGWGRRLVRARGPTDPRLAALGMLVLTGLWLVSLPVVSGVSRTLEAAADYGAVTLTEDAAAQVRLRRTLVMRDLSDPFPPRWQVVLFASHPPSGDRLLAAVAYAEREGLELPTLPVLEDEEALIRHPRIR